MADPNQAADVLTTDYGLDLIEAEEEIDVLRRACGWGGEGDPPAVVIMGDGRLCRLRLDQPARDDIAEGRALDWIDLENATLVPVVEDGRQ